MFSTGINRPSYKNNRKVWIQYRSASRRFSLVSYWVSKCNSQFDGTCRAYTAVADSPAVDVTNFTSELWNPITHGSVIESMCYRTVCRVSGKLIALHAFRSLRDTRPSSRTPNLWSGPAMYILALDVRSSVTVIVSYIVLILQISFV